MNKTKVLFILLSLLTFSSPSAWSEETLTWGDCIAEAKKNHPDLISAAEQVNQSVAAKKITASTLFPQVNAELNAATAMAGGGSEKTTSQTADAYSYRITGSQLLFDGLKTFNNVKAAGENINASKQNYRFVSTEVRLRLRTAFVNLLRAQELIHVAEDIVKIRRENLELITLRYQSGLEHRGALLTAEANLADAQFSLSQAQRDVELAQRQLTKEMGRKEFQPMSVRAEFKVVDAASEKPDFQEIAKDNPTLAQAIAQKNAAEFGLKSSYANFFPTLSGQAGAGRIGTQWPPQGDDWNLGLTLSLPLFEGGLRFAQVSQARALLNQLQASERSTKDGIIVNLEQAWVFLRDAVERVGVQYKTLLATEERAKIAEAEYSTGFITYDNWTIIEDNLVSAKTDYLNSEANAMLAEANWIQAKGETLEYAP